MLRIFLRPLSAFCLLLILSVSVLVAPTEAQAALTLDKIGADTVVGTSLTRWVTGQTNPRFEGTAAPNATVTISISDQQSLAKADATGKYLYTPTNLSEAGSSQVSVTDGTETISFSLEIGANAGATPTPTPTPTPAAAAAAATPTPTPVAATATTKGGQPVLPNQLPETGAHDVVWLLVGGCFFILTGFMSRTVFAQLEAND